MRPKRLTLAGLQSYRKEQTIDFEQLCASGVFGIFGPTGSGKSTILDAITLALYGRVERATNGTQGIMNQAEDQLSVSFSFQLSHGSSEEHYVVERQYKRRGDTSLQQTVSRLMEMTDEGTVVLADRATEVDRLVQELLGLTMADFTRAVVLPQGKFSEFLSLRGTDRRAMLQRLFHLEEYGIGLNQKLAAQIKQNELTLKQLEAEQSGLGDASELAVQQAIERLEAAKKLHVEARNAWKLAEEKYQQQKQRLDWQKELQVVLKRKEELDAQEPLMQSIAQKLELAADANLLKPYIDQFEQAADQAAQLRDHFNVQEASFNRAKLDLEKAREAHQTANIALTQKESGLIIQIEQFREAVEWSVQLLAERKQIETAKQQVSALKQSVEQKQAELQKERELRTKALDKQAALQQEAARLEVTPEERSIQRKMNLDRQAIVHAQQQLEQHERDVIVKQQVVENIFKNVEALSSSRSRLTEQVSHFASELAILKQNIATTQQTEHHFKSLAAHCKEMIQAAEREHYHHQLAAQLAADLTEGKPCPVCGSVEHPSPIQDEQDAHHNISSTDSLRLSEAYEQLEHLQRDHAQHEQTIHQLKWQTAAMEKELIEQLNVLSSDGTSANDESLLLREAASALEKKIENDAFQADGLAIQQYKEASVEQWLERVNQLSTKLLASMEETLQMASGLEQQCNNWIQSSKELIEQSRQLSVELKAAEDNLRDAKQKAQHLAQKLAQLLKQWTIDYPDVLYEQAEERIKQFEADEQKLDELKQRIAKSVPFIENIEAIIRKLDDELRENEKNHIQAESDYKHREEKCRELELALSKRVGEAAPETRLRQAENELFQLRETDQRTRSELEQAQQHYERISEQFSAAKEAVRSAEERLKRAESELQEGLKASRFDEMIAVKNAYLSAQEQQNMRQQLEEYKEQCVKTKQEEKRLKQQIGEHDVTQEAWEETRQLWQQAKQNDEQALQEMAKAERDREDVIARHERWKALESLRQKEAEKQERLGKLQRVFRGNAFVEFIAEEQLSGVSRDASARLGELTRQRYAIEVDSAGGFLIRDNANGGVKRPVSTLSGGETFLTSLALALALSAQIQLRGKYPLEFFFLDEGFGTLDGDLLETVISALERLHMDRLSVGVISHVPELRARLPRKLIIHPASPGGEGSRVEVETI